MLGTMTNSLRSCCLEIKLYCIVCVLLPLLCCLCSVAVIMLYRLCPVAAILLSVSSCRYCVVLYRAVCTMLPLLYCIVLYRFVCVVSPLLDCIFCVVLSLLCCIVFYSIVFVVWPSPRSVVYAFHINQPSLPTPFNLFLCQFLSRKIPAFSFCASGLVSALLALSTTYLIMKVSLSPDVIPCG